MLDIGRVKPLLGAAPFHTLEDEHDKCAFCGATLKEICDNDIPFCPVVLEANKKAGDVWMETIKKGMELCHADLTGVLADLTLHT